MSKANGADDAVGESNDGAADRDPIKRVQTSSKAFRRDTVAGAPPLLELPAARPRPPRRGLTGQCVHLVVGADVRVRPAEVAGRCRVVRITAMGRG